MAEGSRGGRVAAFVAAAVLILVVGGAFALKAVFTQERLRTEIQTRAGDALGLPVEMRAANLSLYPLGIELDDLKIGGGEAGLPSLLELKYGRIKLGWRQLLKARIAAGELLLVEPRIAVRRDANGLVLPGKLAQEPAEKAAEAAAKRQRGSPDTVIDRVVIENGTLHLTGPRPEDEVVLTGLDFAARVAVSEGGDRVQSNGDLSLKDLALTQLAPYRETLDKLSPKVRFDFDYRGSKGTLDLASLGLVAGPLDLMGKGKIHGLPDQPVIDFAIEPSTVALEELLPLVPPALIPEGRQPRATGPVRFSATLRGPLADPTTPPSYLIDLELQGNQLGMQGFEIGLSDVKGKVTAADTLVVFQGVTASLGQGNLALDGRMAGPTSPDSGAVDMHVKSAMDLAILDRAGFLPDGGDAAGLLNADVQIRGKTTAPELADLRGTVRLSDGKLVMPNLPVPMDQLQGAAELSGGDAVLTGISGRLGRSAFKGQGRVRNVLGKKPIIHLTGTSPMLDLIELAPPPGTDKKDTTPAKGDAKARSDSLPSLVPELPPTLVAHLELAVDSLIAPNTTMGDAVIKADIADSRAQLSTTIARANFGEKGKQGVALSNVSGAGTIAEGKLDATFKAPKGDAYKVPVQTVDGKLAVAGRRVDVRDVTAGLFTGKIAGNVVVDMRNPGAPAFDIDTKAIGLQANDFLSALTPAKNVLYGKLDVTSKFSGKGIDPKAIAASLVANGRVQGNDGRLERAPHVQAIWNALHLQGKDAITFGKMNTPFAIRGGQLVTDGLELTSSEATWRAKGALGFDGKLDYDVQVELGDKLASEFKQRAGKELAMLLGGSSGKITLDLKVTGPAKAPQVTIDTAALAKRAQSNAADRLKDKAEDARDKLLEKLLPKPSADSVRADSTTASADSVKKPPTIEDALKGILGRGGK